MYRYEDQGQRYAEGVRQREEVCGALGRRGIGDAQGSPLGRVLCPFAVGEHGGEEAVVGKVHESYDGLGQIGQEDGQDDGIGSFEDVEVNDELCFSG